MNRRISPLVAVLAIMSLIMGATVVGASTGLIIQGPEDRPVAPPPLLAPPDRYSYTPIAPGNLIVPPDGRPVAQLSVPNNFETVSVNFLPDTVSPETKDTVAFQILSSIRYEGTGGRILVTTSRPSETAMTTPLNLGSEVTLANGATAWAARFTGPGEYPNRVTQTKNGLVILVAGALPLEKLQELAANVIMR